MNLLNPNPLPQENAKHSSARRTFLPLPRGAGRPVLRRLCEAGPVLRRLCEGGREQPGFTLTELLVVIATLLIVAAMVGTALATTKPNTLAFQCLNNLRQLDLAWKMYSDDNQGKLVYNSRGGAISWARGFMDRSSTPDNTNTDLLINHARYFDSAFLGPYLKTASVFKCPADNSVVTFGAEQFPRVRSISLNNFMGPYDFSSTPLPQPIPFTPTLINWPPRPNDLRFWTSTLTALTTELL